MATTHTSTKTRSKSQSRRTAGKASTATSGGSRHDYTKLIGVKVKNPVELVKHVEKGLAFTAVEALLQAVGDNWISRGSSVVLRVPSAVIDSEYNYLINPVHRDFKKLKIGSMEVFKLDQRLIS